MGLASGTQALRPEGRRIRTVCLIVFLAGSGVLGWAQEALRNAIRTGDAFAARHRAASAAQPRDEPGWKAGPVRFSVGVSYSLQFSDNVNYSQSNPASDLIQYPSVRLGMTVPVSQRSSLTFQAGVGYRSYWHNSGLSRWVIAPGSVLAYDVQVKDVYFTFFNRFEFTQDVNQQAGLAGVAVFPRFENTLGTQIAWIPSDWILSGGYSYQVVISDSDQFNYLDRNSHLLFGRAGRLFGQGAGNTGVEVSATLTDYSQNLNSDTTVVSLGPYLDWQATDAITLGLRGGYVFYTYTTVIVPGQPNNQSSYYLGLTADQRLTDAITHDVRVTHSVQPGVQAGSAFVVETVLGYGVRWRFVDPASLGFNLSYTLGQQEVSGGLGPSEDYQQARVGIGLTYEVISRLVVGVGYDFSVRDSNLDGRNYTENRITLRAGYTF